MICCRGSIQTLCWTAASGARGLARGRGRTLMSGTLGTAIRCSVFSCRTMSDLRFGAAPRQDSPPLPPRARLVVLMPLEPAIACVAATQGMTASWHT